ncbi:MAG TPA: hypothetical protein VMY99_04990 [Nevskiaceae bacterium]|nr:hypothetical protein [Nevskiaceae bacterium]
MPETLHGHSHNHDHCHKKHGRLSRLVEHCGQAAVARVRNERAKLALAGALRIASLAICPGDEIYPLALKAYVQTGGHALQHESYHDPLAVVPRATSHTRPALLQSGSVPSAPPQPGPQPMPDIQLPPQDIQEQVAWNNLQNELACLRPWTVVAGKL